MSNNKVIALATGRTKRPQRVRSRRKQKEKEEKKEQEANEEKQNASASSQSAPVDAAKKEEKEETEANEEKMNLSEKKNLSTSFQSAPSSALDAPITISLAPMTKLFLGGLSQKTTTEDLEDHFSKFAGMLREYPSPLLTGYPWNHKLDIFRSRSICESCRKSGTKFLKIFCTHIRRSDSKLLDFQVPRYLKSGLGRAGLGPWVGPWQCCAGAPAARRRAPAQHCHGPTQGPSPARPRPDLRYLGTWKSKKSEISKISRSVHSG